MKLTRSFLKRIYAYEISYPGFAEEALSRLEAAGCSRAREYYAEWVTEYQSKRDAELREVAKKYIARLSDERKIEEKEVGKLRKNNLQSMSREELTALCQELLKAGIITDPSQFAIMAQQGY